MEELTLCFQIDTRPGSVCWPVVKGVRGFRFVIGDLSAPPPDGSRVAEKSGFVYSTQCLDSKMRCASCTLVCDAL